MTNLATTDGFRLSELADRVAIQELTALHNDLIDDAQTAEALDEFVQVYVRDGVFSPQGMGRFEGHEAIKQAVTPFAGRVVHLTIDPVIAIVGDNATQRCRLLIARKHAASQPFTVVATGRLRDRLIRTPQGWRFLERVVTFDRPFEEVAAALVGPDLEPIP